MLHNYTYGEIAHSIAYISTHFIHQLKTLKIVILHRERKRKNNKLHETHKIRMRRKAEWALNLDEDGCFAFGIWHSVNIQPTNIPLGISLNIDF